jgi:hypothetical protein
MVDVLAADGKARESIRKSKTALAMVLDHAGISPNPARDMHFRKVLSSQTTIVGRRGSRSRPIWWSRINDAYVPSLVHRGI